MTFQYIAGRIAGGKVTVVEDIKQELIGRIIDPFYKGLECEDGWLPLLADMHSKVVELDPHYTLYQVKEKFGGLCFYYALSNPTVAEEFRNLVNFFETMSLTICEKSGLAGRLMTKNGRLKTLNDLYLNEGWQPA